MLNNKDWYRPRSIGETRWLLHSDDDEETVKQWYRDLTMQVLEEKRTRGIAHSDYRVTAAESGRQRYCAFKHLRTLTGKLRC